MASSGPVEILPAHWESFAQIVESVGLDRRKPASRVRRVAGATARKVSVMEFRFDHVGFLTPDVDYSFGVYRALGCDLTERTYRRGCARRGLRRRGNRCPA